MRTLVDALNDPSKKPAIIGDCLALIDEEVKDKSGLSGMAVKAGYGAVKGIKPGFIRSVVEGLLPEFAQALEPVERDARTQGVPLGAHMVSRSGSVADALLAVTATRKLRSRRTASSRRLTESSAALPKSM